MIIMKEKNKICKLLFLLMGCIFLINLVSANIIVDINIQDSFGLEEQMSFEYSFLSNIDEEINFISHINCPNVPIAILDEQTISLQANQPYTTTYTDQVVQDWFEPQTCKAYVQILSPIQKVVSKNFTINTAPSFEFDIKLDKKIFVVGEDIVIDYSSDVSGLNVDVKLIYPDERTENINLPKTIKAEQIGTYKLEVTASKEGYKTITKKEQFAVIEKHAEIGEVEVQDVVGDDVGVDPEDQPKKVNRNVLFWIVIGVAIIFILGLIVAIIFMIVRVRRRGF
ncbi:MAG: hypothetical protein U9Q06_03895 [Nanoarchaeota archaeon]|nr:hypothetical protein [Nanoarchaeota archaeon]